MQTVFIIEIQSNNDGTAAIPAPLGFRVENQAQENAVIARFCTVCAAAAESACDYHTVRIIDSYGNVWRGYDMRFEHGHEVEA